MRARLIRAFDWSATAACLLFVALFIGADLVESAGWDWRGWLRELKEHYAASDPPEIRNYVEFVTVKHDGLDITTGISFDSSNDRRITRQWCYAEPSNRVTGKAIYRIELAVVENPGPPEPYPFSEAELRPFGLTRQEARSLLDNHCRFRN